jgi:hypothetical protein
MTVLIWIKNANDYSDLEADSSGARKHSIPTTECTENTEIRMEGIK